eukprot:EG_transcript_449
MAPWGWLALLLAGLGWWAAGAALLPRRPGQALALNARTNTEYAYSYPRSLAPTFTLEMWLNGYAQAPESQSPISIAHPHDDNMFSVTDHVKVFNTRVIPVLDLPVTRWFHLAVSVDLSAYPTYDVQAYIDGLLVQNGTGEFEKGITPADIEKDVLAIVFGQEQDWMLGGWDTAQIYSGHLDEFRIWNTVRSAEEVWAWCNVTLTAPYPPALVSYYTFDDSSWGATYISDLVNSSDQHRIYVADYANATTAPTLPPAYSPPLAPLPRLAVSTAPLCSDAATNGWLPVRVGPASGVAVPVAALYCNAANAAVTATVTAVVGGTVTAGGKAAVGVPLSSTTTVTFVATNGNLAAGTGFNFTAQDGSAAAAGFVAVLPNNIPTLAAQLSFVSDEDLAVTAWIAVVDEDRDIVHLEVSVPALAGSAELDGLIDRKLRYAPPANAYGLNVGHFGLQARDMWGGLSSMTWVNVSLNPVVDPPQLLMNSSFTIYRGQRISIPFDMFDVDGNDDFLVVSDWPAAEEGILIAEDQGQRWTVNEGSVPSKWQWATGYGNYSSTGKDNATDYYGVAQFIGPPTCSEYGDCPDAWSPASLTNGCVNQAKGAEALYTFYTEFVEATFAMPMYLTALILWENNGGDRVTRLRVPSDRNSAQWKTIMQRDVANSPVSAAATKLSITSFQVCQVVWPVDRVRVEADTCHRDGYYEIDAIQMRGSLVAPKNVLNVTARLTFQATPGYTGPVDFGLMATSCYSSFDATSTPLTVTVLVVDTPHVITVAVRDGWSAIDVGQLDSGPRSGNVLVLELPTQGTLQYNGHVANSTLQDLGSTSTVFDYEPFRCSAALLDSFIIQLGPTAVVQVMVRGCTADSSMLIAIVVPCVVGPVSLLLAAALWRQRRGRRDNSRAPKDPDQDVWVLFTDIQASTTLWAEIPELMAPALDAHHALIRRLIRKFKCYEVKTVGDCFMVATASATAALQLSLAIQVDLYQYDWEGDGLDEAYRRLTECPLSPDAYAHCWRGLRVRVGMHYGPVQITFDETTKGYDYYGTVVNAASRIEGIAHGGQIVMPHSALHHVADYCRANDVALQPLGTVQLRGLADPLDLIQVLPARLANRVFPPLRTDRPDKIPADAEDNQSENPRLPSEQVPDLQYPQALDWEALNHPLVRSGVITSEVAKFHAYDVFFALKSQLKMYKGTEERKKKLAELCQLWHVPYRAATQQQENATLGKLALQLMGSVAIQIHMPKGHASTVASNTPRTEASPQPPRFLAGAAVVHPDPADSPQPKSSPRPKGSPSALPSPIFRKCSTGSLGP